MGGEDEKTMLTKPTEDGRVFHSEIILGGPLQQGTRSPFLMFLLGAMLVFVVEEALYHSGTHPAAVRIRPESFLTALKLDPELEILLGQEQLRQRSDQLQNALQAARHDYEQLERKNKHLEEDYHFLMNGQGNFSEVGEFRPQMPLSPQCLLAVKETRERVCPCDASLCPVLYKGDDCTQPVEDLPECLALWNLPHREDLSMYSTVTNSTMWTLNQEQLTSANPEKDPSFILMGPQPAGKPPFLPSAVSGIEVTESLLRLLPERPALQRGNNGKGKHRSCALVGNSDSLLRTYQGDEITDHTLIARFNGAITKGYEEHVGRITNIRFVNDKWLGFREFPLETVIRLDNSVSDFEALCRADTKCREGGGPEGKSCGAEGPCKEGGKSTLMEQLRHMRSMGVSHLNPPVTAWLSGVYEMPAPAGTSPAELLKIKSPKYQAKKIKHRLTVGFQAMMLLMHVCEKVDLYGFVGNVEDSHQLYFDSSQVVQKFGAQMQQWQSEMAANGKINYPFQTTRFRHLLGRKGPIKSAGQPPSTAIAPLPNYEWERGCHQDMVKAGLISVHGMQVNPEWMKVQTNSTAEDEAIYIGSVV